jgi:hypothetical protein
MQYYCFEVLLIILLCRKHRPAASPQNQVTAMAQPAGIVYLYDGNLGHIGAGLAGQSAPSGHDQLDGVLDHDGVIDQVTVVWALQH